MTSPSTLIRQAKQAEKKGHRFAAKRLREQAAKLRREAREAKNYAASVSAELRKKKRKKPHKIVAALQQAVQHAMVAAPLMEPDQEAKSWLEVAVDRVLGEKATEEQRIGMRRELVEARKMGVATTDEAYQGQLRAVTEANRIKMVSGLIAIAEHAEKLNGGLPHTMVVSGYTLAKVIDALKLAGYTRDGLNGSGTTREAIAARHSEGKRWVVHREDTDEEGVQRFS